MRPSRLEFVLHPDTEGFPVGGVDSSAIFAYVASENIMTSFSFVKFGCLHHNTSFLP